MKLFGLTGGVGMGKSTAAMLLAQWGLPVVDTDLIARDMVEPGQPALDQIQAAFGREVIGTDGRLRRDALAKLVFPHPEARQRLESILHPRIREAWHAQVQRWREQNREAGVVVIPLLFETNAAAQFDATICVVCSAKTQLERLWPRGWTEEQIRQRIEAQWPIEKKINASDLVVWTEGSLSVHRAQLERILNTLGVSATQFIAHK